MQARLKQLGLTPAKGALVAGLMLLLVIIWGPQMVSFASGSGASSSKATVRSTGKPSHVNARKPARNTANSAKSTSKAAVSTSKLELPTITSFEAASYDPFKVPSWSPAVAMLAQQSNSKDKTTSYLSKEEIAARKDSLRQAGVAMVLVSSVGQIAKIGDQTVQVGDEIDGYRVTKITAEGVELVPNASRPSNEEDRDDSPSSL